MHKSCPDRSNSKANHARWNEPSWANVLAEGIPRYLEENVRDIKDRKEGVIVVAFQMKVLLKTRDASVTCSSKSTAGPVFELEVLTYVRPINETKY